MSELVVEMLLEEMPPADIDNILSGFGAKVDSTLVDLNVDHGNVEVFSTSRRFGFFVRGISEKQKDLLLERKGPSKNVAYRDGKPTKALEGFLRSNEAAEEDIEFMDLNGTEYVYLHKKVAGRPTKEVLSEALPKLFSSLQFNKPMRWGNGENRYVRPVHSILALMEGEVVEFEFMGRKASNLTKSHWYLGKTLTISDAADYKKRLGENMVVIGAEDRRKMVTDSIKSVGPEVVEDENLVHEISLITEYPQPVVGRFKEDYLALPEPVLKTVLRHHQRTFIVRGAEGIAREFLAFQDGEPSRSGNVRKGYERVINARLEDAKFFYEEDTSVSLEQFNEKLHGMAFQRGLGTIADKTERTRAIALDISKSLGLGSKELDIVDRAVTLSKSDLGTNMVYEFPELQGIMGRIYASKTEDERVALSVYEQYMPDGFEGEMPSDIIGAIVGLADRLDTVVANFAIGEIPSGSKDPYGLRKKVFAILNVLNSFNWDLDLSGYIRRVGELLEKEVPEDLVSEFFKGRLDAILRERYSISQDASRAVLGSWNRPLRARIAAQTIDKYRQAEGFDDFIVAYNRVHNISSKHTSSEYHVELLDDEEKPLFRAYLEAKPMVEEEIEHLNYDGAFNHLRELKPLIDDYFNTVYVMTTQADLRLSRLGFLKSLDDLFLMFGELSLLETK